jgi:PilZ domain-containing protein
MRAPRFPLHLKVRYRRAADDAAWNTGVTENISHSGALVRVTDPLQVDTPVEVRLVLPASPRAGEHAEVSCRGRVVRTVAAEGRDDGPAFAVAIDAYDFLPAAVDFSPSLTV